MANEARKMVACRCRPKAGKTYMEPDEYTVALFLEVFGTAQLERLATLTAGELYASLYAALKVAQSHRAGM
jgi:hypothetical protein